MDIWERWRKEGVNVSEKISRLIIQEGEKEEKERKPIPTPVLPSLSNCFMDITNGNDDSSSRIRPSPDISFVINPQKYNNPKLWSRFFSYAKPQEVIDLNEMLEYGAKQTQYRARLEKRTMEEKRWEYERQVREQERLQREAVVEKAAQEHHDKAHKQALADIVSAGLPQQVMVERTLSYLEQTRNEGCSVCNKKYYEAHEILEDEKKEKQRKEQQLQQDLERIKQEYEQTFEENKELRNQQIRENSTASGKHFAWIVGGKKGDEPPETADSQKWNQKWKEFFERQERLKQSILELEQQHQQQQKQEQQQRPSPPGTATAVLVQEEENQKQFS
jgi:hypothetical protein